MTLTRHYREQEVLPVTYIPRHNTSVSALDCPQPVLARSSRSMRESNTRAIPAHKGAHHTQSTAVWPGHASIFFPNHSLLAQTHKVKHIPVRPKSPTVDTASVLPIARRPPPLSCFLTSSRASGTPPLATDSSPQECPGRIPEKAKRIFFFARICAGCVPPVLVLAVVRSPIPPRFFCRAPCCREGDEEDDERQQGTLLLQRLIRGRAVQNVMFDGQQPQLPSPPHHRSLIRQPARSRYLHLIAFRRAHPTFSFVSFVGISDGALARARTHIGSLHVSTRHAPHGTSSLLQVA